MASLARTCMDISRKQARFGHWVVGWHMAEWLYLDLAGGHGVTTYINLVASALMAAFLYYDARRMRQEAMRAAAQRF